MENLQKEYRQYNRQPFWNVGIFVLLLLLISSLSFAQVHVQAGTNENVAFYIRLNNTTDYTITTTGRLNGSASFVTSSNYSMSVPIMAGDYIEFKVYTPNFATNPGNTYFHATIEFE